MAQFIMLGYIFRRVTISAEYGSGSRQPQLIQLNPRYRP